MKICILYTISYFQVVDNYHFLIGQLIALRAFNMYACMSNTIWHTLLLYNGTIGIFPGNFFTIIIFCYLYNIFIATKPLMFNVASIQSP